MEGSLGAVAQFLDTNIGLVASIGKIALALVIALQVAPIMVWVERRQAAFIQRRIGPNRVGLFGFRLFGLGQPLADTIKLLFKEDFIPQQANKFFYVLAPILPAVIGLVAIQGIPLGKEIIVAGHTIDLQPVNLNAGFLYLFAMSALGVYGVALAGWSSNNKYALLGGLRASAQMISYEIAMGLSFVAVFLYAGSMSTSEIVNAQSSVWYIVLLLPSFAIYVTAMVGETNRAPFDLPEAEGELVGGFHTEYSSLKFALFFLAEYVNMVTVSALATTLFLGGWRAPSFIEGFWPAANEGWMPLVWFLAKVFTFLFVFIWLRGTLPRLRYDQFMRFGWKVLIPAAIVWLLVVATARALRNQGTADTKTLLIGAGLVMVAVFLLSTIVERQQKAKQEQLAAERAVRESESFSKYPVPLTAAQLAAAAPIVVQAVAPATADEGSESANSNDNATEANNG